VGIPQRRSTHGYYPTGDLKTVSGWQVPSCRLKLVEDRESGNLFGIEESRMTTIWITYAWEDNKASDIDFIAQEIQSTGLQVKLDRWNIRVGHRLWEQIANFIQDTTQCDAWLLVATQASLGSEPCREEFAYALDRALNSRSSTFPVIALFPATIDNNLIPAAIRVRLHVSLRDPDWKERIAAAAEGRNPHVQHPPINPFHFYIHEQANGSNRYVIEVRPRAGSWSPFVAAVPLGENSRITLRIMYGASGYLPNMSCCLNGYFEGTNQEWAICSAQNEATPTMSYYLFCKELPSKVLFGIYNGIQYVQNLR
jgi:hypothetical protein